QQNENNKLKILKRSKKRSFKVAFEENELPSRLMNNNKNKKIFLAKGYKNDNNIPANIIYDKTDISIKTKKRKYNNISFGRNEIFNQLTINNNNENILTKDNDNNNKVNVYFDITYGCQINKTNSCSMIYNKPYIIKGRKKR